MMVRDEWRNGLRAPLAREITITWEAWEGPVWGMWFLGYPFRINSIPVVQRFVRVSGQLKYPQQPLITIKVRCYIMKFEYWKIMKAIALGTFILEFEYWEIMSGMEWFGWLPWHIYWCWSEMPIFRKGMSCFFSNSSSDNFLFNRFSGNFHCASWVGLINCIGSSVQDSYF